jgi:hypothetical protein
VSGGAGGEGASAKESEPCPEVTGTDAVAGKLHNQATAG